MTADGRWLSPDPSPHRAQAISANLGGGHVGLGWDCSSILSWEGALGMSASLVVMGWTMPWATDWDPLGQAQQLLLWLQLQSHGVSSASLGKLTSTQLEGAVATKTSSSIKDTSGSIACWSSTTLCQVVWFTQNWQLGLLCPVLECSHIGESGMAGLVGSLCY